MKLPFNHKTDRPKEITPVADVTRVAGKVERLVATRGADTVIATAKK